MNLWLILFGLIGGVIGGMGMGGGTLLIPLLTLFGGISQHLAQSINLIAFLPMATVALIFHIKNKLVDFKRGFLVIIPAMATAILGAMLAKLTPADLLKFIFGIFLIVLGVCQFISIFFMKTKKAKEGDRAKK